MTKKKVERIANTGKRAERIVDTSKKPRRISGKAFAKAIGAEPCERPAWVPPRPF